MRRILTNALFFIFAYSGTFAAWSQAYSSEFTANTSSKAYATAASTNKEEKEEVRRTKKGCLTLYEYAKSKLWAARIENTCDSKISVRFCAIIELSAGTYNSCAEQKSYYAGDRGSGRRGSFQEIERFYYNSTNDAIGYVYEGVPVEFVASEDSYLLPGKSMYLTRKPSDECVLAYRSGKVEARDLLISPTSGVRYCRVRRGDTSPTFVYTQGVKKVQIYFNYCSKYRKFTTEFCLIGYPSRRWCFLGYEKKVTIVPYILSVTSMSDGLPSAAQCIYSWRDEEALPSMGSGRPSGW